jgi:two-component system, NarL family, response regulator LiaR
LEGSHRRLICLPITAGLKILFLSTQHYPQVKIAVFLKLSKTISMRQNIFSRNKHTILYSLCLALLLILLKWLELRLVIINHSFEIYVGAIALIFTALGIWLALKLSKPKVETVLVEKTVYINNTKESFTANEKVIADLNISKRELEVLQLMAEGLSNSEIAGRLYVSLSTIKSHSQNIFDKLAVGRRTQAVDKGRKLNIIR